MPKHNHGIVRAHYDAVLERFADGRWVCDPDAGTIWSHHVGRLLKPTVREHYAYLSIWYGGKNCSVTLSRAIWESVHGPIPDGLEVNHKNGDKLDDRIGNYEIVTTSENQRHALSTGLYVPKRGSAKGRRASLNEMQVAEIRDLCSQRVSQCEIARRYGVSQTTVSHINLGRTWTHVPGGGSTHRPGVKLTAGQVREIRQLLAAGESQASVGRRFGVTQSCVYAIHAGRTWSHVS